MANININELNATKSAAIIDLKVEATESSAFIPYTSLRGGTSKCVWPMPDPNYYGGA